MFNGGQLKFDPDSTMYRVTSFAAQDWTSGLGLKKKQEWRPWTVDGCRRMGGYVQRYEESFDFLTIRGKCCVSSNISSARSDTLRYYHLIGAGHMVPTYKPDASFAFLSAWIQNEDYPHFDKNCDTPSFREIEIANE